MKTPDIAFIADLEAIVLERLEKPTAASYSAELATAGTKRIAQKVGEEAVELAIAAATGDRDETVNEAADLLYHLIVLLAEQRLSLEDVAQELASRHQASG